MLVFDDGLGGYLPLSKADIHCDCLSFASAGIAPSPTTLMVMAEGVCVVKRTRCAPYRHWLLAEDEAAPERGLLARAARLVTEITLGLGDARASHRSRERGARTHDTRTGGGLALGQFYAPFPPSSGNSMSGVNRARRGYAVGPIPHPAITPVRPTSTSPASSLIWAMVTILPPLRSSVATIRCRWSAALSVQRPANQRAFAEVMTAPRSSGR